MKETLRLKTHVKAYLSEYNDDATKAIESIVEENKSLKAQVSVLQNVTHITPVSSQFVTGATYSSTPNSVGLSSGVAPSMRGCNTVTIPAITFDAEYWKKLKTTVDSALEPYGRQ